MKILIIGLGSMGSRRIRCLQSLGYSDLTGYDIRDDRRENANKQYGIRTVQLFNSQIISQFDVVIVSTPPDLHAFYVEQAIQYGKPTFLEASVVIEDVLKIQKANIKNVFVAPSCTMVFHPAIKSIKEIITSGKYGHVTNFSYHSGQYLPDWHPWEKMSDYYVSNRETGAAREIVPFELTWIVNIFNFPEEIIGLYGKYTNLPIKIDDVYTCILRYKNFLGTLTVDVTSRFATRSLIFNLENAQIRWSWEEKSIKIYEVKSNKWLIIKQPEFKAHNNYNENIGEQMYIDEIKSFLNGITDNQCYPNTIEKDIKVLRLLNQIEINSLKN